MFIWILSVFKFSDEMWIIQILSGRGICILWIQAVYNRLGDQSHGICHVDCNLWKIKIYKNTYFCCYLGIIGINRWAREEKIFPRRGIEPRPPRWERGILTTRLPGKLLNGRLISYIKSIYFNFKQFFLEKKVLIAIWLKYKDTLFQ